MLSIEKINNECLVGKQSPQTKLFLIAQEIRDFSPRLFVVGIPDGITLESVLWMFEAAIQDLKIGHYKIGRSGFCDVFGTSVEFVSATVASRSNRHLDRDLSNGLQEPTPVKVAVNPFSGSIDGLVL